MEARMNFMVSREGIHRSVKSYKSSENLYDVSMLLINYKYLKYG